MNIYTHPKQIVRHDKICLNWDCIANQNAFYQHLEQEEQHRNHKTLPIHSVDICKVLGISKKKVFQGKFQTSIEEQVKAAVKSSCNRLAEHFYQTLFEAKIEKHQKQTQMFSDLAVDKIVYELSGGSNFYLKLIKYFQQKPKASIVSKVTQLFKNRQAQLLQQVGSVEKKLKCCMEQLKCKIEEMVEENEHRDLQAHIQAQIGNNEIDYRDLQAHIQAQIGINENQLEMPSRPDKQLNMFSSFAPKTQNKKQPIMIWDDEVYNVKIEEPQPEQNDEEGQKLNASSPRKRKPIKKDQKPPQSQPKIHTQKSTHNAQTELIIRYPTKLEQWNEVLSTRDLKQIRSLTIFDPDYTTQGKIFQLLNFFPNLTQINFNCKFLLHKQPLNYDLLPLLSQITINFKWSYQFIKQYYELQYFGRRNLENRQAIITRRNQNLSKITFAMKQSRSLWVFEVKLLDELQRRRYDFSKLVTLNIGCRIECKQLKKVREVKSLRTLVLKSMRFDELRQENNNILVQLIQNNPNITTFILGNQLNIDNIISQTIVPQDTLHRILQGLSSLKLKRLSISLFEQIRVRVDSKLLFSHPHLQFLNLRAIRFNNESLGKEYNKTASLTNKLTFFSLHECLNLPKQLLTSLLLNSTETLTHLYIGQCPAFEDRWLPMLVPLVNLTFLNLDQLQISGKQLVETLKQIKKTKGNQLKLQYLGIDRLDNKRQPNFHRQHMDQISEIAPLLKCLSIQHQKQLRSFDFRRFASLEAIKADEKLRSHLKIIYEKLSFPTVVRNKVYFPQC